MDIALSSGDEKNLRWFFSHGQTAFQHSTMGPMLAHAQLYAVLVPWWEPPPEVTAYPTAELRQAAGYVPDDRALTTYASVTRTLEGVARYGTGYVFALQAYWGDAGDRFSLSRYGRLLGLYHLTPAGKRLLKAGKGDSSTLPPHERMGVEVELQRVQPTVKRREALLIADKEAEALYAASCARWNCVRASELAGELSAAC